MQADRDTLRAHTLRLLGGLGLPGGALLAVAESAGAPPAGCSPSEAEDLLQRCERAQALPRALRLLADAVPEQAEALCELARAWERLPPPQGPIDRASAALRAARTALDSPWAWRWRRAEAPLQQAHALLDGPLREDPEQAGARSLALHLDQLVAELPARLRATPGHALARHLARWRGLATMVYSLGQGAARLPGAWPLAPWIIALYLIAHAPRIAVEPGVDLRGYALGQGQRDGHRLATSTLTLRSAPPRLGAARHGSAPRARHGDAAPGEGSPGPRPPPRDPALSTPPPPPEPAVAPLAELAPSPEPPGPAEASPLAEEVEGGPLRGSGSIRHTALPDQAPMAFLGVPGLSSQADQPVDAELWVAQTEVTEDQWLALMRLDLAILTGQPERPAEHMTFCEAMEYANRLSRHENLRPAYDIPRGCERGAPVRWDLSADGYRLPTEAEWERLASDAPADGVTHRGDTRDEPVDAMGLYGVVGNAAELVWGAGGRPIARHRSCKAGILGTNLWPESAPLPCRQELGTGQRTLGVGLRLVRPAP